MNRIRIYLDGDEVDGLMAEADRNLRGMGEQARWWIRQGIAGTLPNCQLSGTSPITDLPSTAQPGKFVADTKQNKATPRGDFGAAT